MKPHFLNKNLSGNIEFSVHRVKEFRKLWHYHPELELVYIANGEGTLYAGDFIGSYQENDVFLLGKNIPHMFHSKSSEDENNYSKALVFHINDLFLNVNFLHLPEFSFLHDILEKTKRGVLYRKKENKKLLDIIGNPDTNSPAESTIKILQVLLHLSAYKEYRSLGSLPWLDRFSIADKRMEKVIEYIMLNFKNEITLEEIAELSALNKSSFCRFFKKNTGKPFILFLNEIRIKYSCELMAEKGAKKPISEICFQSGFNSLSYYNRSFRKITGMSPSEYQQRRVEAEAKKGTAMLPN